MMSFGGTKIDANNVTEEVPGRSALAGLLANALGWHHRDHQALQALQARIRYAVRVDRPGERLVDYHTVELGQPSLVDCGWTTRGCVEERAGAFSKGTHIRSRHYLVGAVYTIALRLEPPDDEPGLDALERALERPARPLFIGRKTCLPAAPILLARREASSLREAAARAEPTPSAQGASRESGPMLGFWPEEEGVDGEAIVLHDDRDWLNQIHVGRRFMRRGWLEGGEDRV